jgi:hypothetical protein
VETSVDIWKGILEHSGASWVLFSNGTCVIVREPGKDLAAQARAILLDWGPVAAGTPYGDFTVQHLKSSPGWLIGCHHPDILTHVGPDEVGPASSDVKIGVAGREKRRQDARDPKVVHVEDSRRGHGPRLTSD